MREKKGKPKNHKRLLQMILGFAVAAYGTIMLVDMQTSLSQRKQELEDISQRVEAQRLANAEIERELTMGLDEEYIERYARDYLGYVSPDQRVFIDRSGS